MWHEDWSNDAEIQLCITINYILKYVYSNRNQLSSIVIFHNITILTVLLYCIDQIIAALVIDLI